MIFKKTLLHSPKHNFGNLLHDKRDFLIKVYGLLCLIIFAVILIVSELHTHPYIENIINKYSLYLFVLGFIIVLLLTRYNLYPIIKLLLIIFLTCIIGLRCIALIEIIPKHVIKCALINILVLFIITSLIGYLLYIFNIKIGFLGIILLYILFSLIITFISMTIIDVPEIFYKFALVCAIILFSIYIIYNTNLMIQDDYNGDIIDGAVELYINVFNIFIEVGALII